MASRPNLEFELSFFESLHKRMPKDLRVASALAHIYTKAGRIDAGLKMDRKLVRLDPRDGNTISRQDERATVLRRLRVQSVSGVDVHAIHSVEQIR